VDAELSPLRVFVTGSARRGLRTLPLITLLIRFHRKGDAHTLQPIRYSTF
jgi:hypothetical protein